MNNRFYWALMNCQALYELFHLILTTHKVEISLLAITQM